MSSKNKIQSRASIRRTAERLRNQGRRLVFTNGCFDLLHAGHVTYLEKAKGFGDVLIVGLNSDASVRRIKGPARPVNSEEDRAHVLAALEAVDYVTLFQEDTPLRLIHEIRPHVMVKGSDWKKSQIAGAQEIKSWGGKVRLVPFVPGRSTTGLLKKIRS